MVTAKLNKIMFEEGDIDVSVESHVKSRSNSATNKSAKPRVKPQQAHITKFFKAPVVQEKNGAVPRAFNKQSTITSWLKRTPKAGSDSTAANNDTASTKKGTAAGVVILD